jgi:hypothetical protein
MSVIALASFSGAPGVTTSAVGAAYNWHRPALLLEADTSKPSGVLPGLMRGQVDHSKGLTPLSLTQQRGELSPQALVGESILLAPERYFVPGFSNPAAGLGTTSLWGALATTIGSLEGAGTDVLIDLGRLAPNDPRSPLLQVADAVVIVLRPVLTEAAAAAAQIGEVRNTLRLAGREDTLGLWTIAAPSPLFNYSGQELYQLLGVPVIGELGHDIRSAAVYGNGAMTPSRFEKSNYIRELRAALSTTTQRITERAEKLGLRPTSSTTTQEVTA